MALSESITKVISPVGFTKGLVIYRTVASRSITRKRSSTMISGSNKALFPTDAFPLITDPADCSASTSALHNISLDPYKTKLRMAAVH